MKRIIENGHKIVLNTMRSGKELEDATNWFKENKIKLVGVNVNPQQKTWTTSPKVYAQLYIDDAALGCPLRFDGLASARTFVDWVEVEKYLEYYDIIKK